MARLLNLVPGAINQLTGPYKLASPTPPAAWTPADLGTDLLSEWDIWDSSKVTLVTGAISQVTDLRGVANMVQATASQRPTLTATSWNGQDIATFSRVQSQILQIGATAAYNQAAADVSQGVFAVFDKTRVATEYVWSHYLGGAALFIECYVATNATFADVSIRIGATSLGVKSFSLANATKVAVYAAVRRSPGDPTKSDYRIYVNGVQTHGADEFAAVTVNTTHSDTAMGGRFNESLFAQSNFGMMAITKYLDATQIANFFTWANTKFALY